MRAPKAKIFPQNIGEEKGDFGTFFQRNLYPQKSLGKNPKRGFPRGLNPKSDHKTKVENGEETNLEKMEKDSG